jgi:hypothetical protein
MGAYEAVDGRNVLPNGGYVAVRVAVMQPCIKVEMEALRGRLTCRAVSLEPLKVQLERGEGGVVGTARLRHLRDAVGVHCEENLLQLRL